MPELKVVLKHLLDWRDYVIIIITPLMLSWLFLFDGTEYQKPARCTFVLFILLVYWTTECLPIAVTALLPMFLYPLLKIISAKELAPKYMSEVNMAFVGSYIMVLAFEYVNLHRRVALRILVTVGAQPRWLLFGIMMSACLLSMFTNNTMACALHLPIIKGIIDELREAARRQSVRMPPNNPTGNDVEMQRLDSPLLSEGGEEGRKALRSDTGGVSLLSTKYPPDNEVLSIKVIDGIEKMLLISASYSASIGGVYTLIGTPTNLIMKERAEIVYDSYNCTNPVTFTSWLVLGLPVGFLCIFIAWFWLQLFFLGPRNVFAVWIVDPILRCFRRNDSNAPTTKDPANVRAERIMAVIKQLYAQLEPMGYRQYVVVAHCIVLIILLITRQMTTSADGGLGWDILAPKFTKESTATILVSAILFAFPASFPNFKTPGAIEPPTPLISWRHVDREFPFGVLLLLGGGMAAAAGAQDSGLPKLIAPFFGSLMKHMPLGLCVLLTAVLASVMTEFMANVACVTLICPIMENLAKELNVNPLLFLFPTAFASSFAFMLPVATPPNAIVFSTNRLKISDMLLCGIGMKVGVLIVTLATTTWGNAYFSLYQPPCSQS